MLCGIRPAQGCCRCIEILAGGAADAVIEKLGIPAGRVQGKLLRGQIITVASGLLPAAPAQIQIVVIEIRRRKIVPYPPRCFLPQVFRFRYRHFGGLEPACVAVQHGAHIFGFLDYVLGVQGAAAHKPSAVRIKLLL
ncbi:hypothetical protein D3C76_1312620 [compost metagenome]